MARGLVLVRVMDLWMDAMALMGIIPGQLKPA